MDRRLTSYAMALLRFFIGGLAVMSWYNATKDPHSMFSQASKNFDGIGFIVVLMAGIGGAIVVDVLVNDVMPARFQWKRALKHRHLLLSFLGLCYVAQPFVGAMSDRFYPLTEYCIFNAIVIYLASLLDAKKRSRELEWALHRK